MELMRVALTAPDAVNFISVALTKDQTGALTI
jgi:hypothetical protein